MPEVPLNLVPLEYTQCPLCGSHDHALKYRKRGIAIPILFNIVCCRQCGFIFTNPRPDNKLTPQIYSAEYYSGSGFDSAFQGDTESKRLDAELLIRCVRDLLGPDRSISMLEVGGGAGLITEVASARGVDCLMLDPSISSIEIARAKGINCYHGSIDDSHITERVGQVDAIVALEVIEHTYDPLAFLQGVHALLRPGGVFIFTTGNVAETVFQGRHWGYMSIPEAHIQFFSTKTMGQFLSKAGFSGRVDAYRYFSKRNIAVRLMERLGLVDLQRAIAPESRLQHAFYRAFKLVETIAGRRRFDWAVK